MQFVLYFYLLKTNRCEAYVYLKFDCKLPHCSQTSHYKYPRTVPEARQLLYIETTVCTFSMVMTQLVNCHCWQVSWFH